MNLRRTPLRSRALAAALTVLLGACTTARPLDAGRRPPTWATPIAIAGVGNLHRVDANLFRSDQPDLAGLQAAREHLGVHTVINLRAFHSDRVLAQRAGLHSIDVGLVPWDIGDEDVVTVLSVLRRREDGPFLMHCLFGADRTGLMIAMYRMVEQNWSREAALDEMLHGGYGFHPILFNIVDYVKNVDIARIRARLALPAPIKAASGQAHAAALP